MEHPWVFAYNGGMNVRPCSRGTVLTDRADGLGIEEVLPPGDYFVEIWCTKRTGKADQQEDK